MTLSFPHHPVNFPERKSALNTLNEIQCPSEGSQVQKSMSSIFDLHGLLRIPQWRFSCLVSMSHDLSPVHSNLPVHTFVLSFSCGSLTYQVPSLHPNNDFPVILLPTYPRVSFFPPDLCSVFFRIPCLTCSCSSLPCPAPFGVHHTIRPVTPAPPLPSP
eukprot:757597-Hanusia_phi.AAC.3